MPRQNPICGGTLHDDFKLNANFIIFLDWKTLVMVMC